jgi:hypothetical protein
VDNVVEREAQDAAALRREAVRAAQKSTTNVFLFRRLKWGPPGGGEGTPPGKGLQISLVDILLWSTAIVAVGILAYVAIR